MSNKNITQPSYNSNVNAWNVPLNTNWQNIDDALGTVQSFNLASVSGNINVNRSSFAGAYPANTASYVPLVWSLTGAPSGTVTLTVPNTVKGQWTVNNGCTGSNAAVNLKVSSGNTIVANPGVCEFYSDGSSVYFMPTVGVGDCLVWSGGSSNIPPNYVKCDNTQYATSTYPALFAIIGHTFGGTGSNFKVPSAPTSLISNLVWIIRAS